MKYLTCILTFLSYSSLHTLRMCYAFNKMYVKKQFLMTDFYLGILDALVYLSLGIGTLMRYTLIRNPLHLTQIYLATSIVSSISIAVISTLGLISDYQDLTKHKHYQLFRTIITIALILFGFMQLTSRPIATSLLGAELRSQQHGCLVGAWATHASAGHISGLLLSNLMVHTFRLKWEVSIFIGAIISISTALIVYFVLQNPIQRLMKKPQQLKKPDKQILIKQQLRPHSSRQFFSFIKKMLKSTQYRYYITTYTITKAMVYTFLLWYPIYLDSVKLKRYSGYITILFQIASIIGSFVLGKLYDYEIKKKLKNRQRQRKNQQNSSIIQKIAAAKSLVSMILVTIFVGIFYVTKQSILGYCLFAFGIGLFLGGTVNTLSSNDIFIFSKNDVRKIDYLTSFNIGFGSCFVGIVQAIIGFTLYEQNEVKGNEGFSEQQITKTHHSYKVLFIILLALSVIVSILFAFKLFLKREQNIDKCSYDVLQQQ